MLPILSNTPSKSVPDPEATRVAVTGPDNVIVLLPTSPALNL